MPRHNRNNGYTPVVVVDNDRGNDGEQRNAPSPGGGRDHRPARSSPSSNNRYDAIDAAAGGLLGGRPGDPSSSSRAARWVARLRVDRGTSAALAACAAYSACSISMVLANKTLVTSFGFNHPFVLMTAQNLVTLALVAGTRVYFPKHAPFSGDGDALLGGGATKGQQARRLPWRTLLRIEPAKARAWAPVTALFVAMLCTSFQALHHIASDSQGNIYTAEAQRGRRAQKFRFTGMVPRD